MAGRNRSRNRIGALVIALIVLILCGVIFYKQKELDTEYEKMQDNIEQLEKDYNEEEQRQIELKREAAYRNTDDYIRQLARKLFNLYDPDDVIFEEGTAGTEGE